MNIPVSYGYFREETDNLSDIVPSVQAVTDVASTVDYVSPHHKLHIINDGASRVYYAFDQVAEATDSFSRLDSGESKIYEGEFTTISLICGSGETGDIRLEARQ